MCCVHQVTIYWIATVAIILHIFTVLQCSSCVCIDCCIFIMCSYIYMSVGKHNWQSERSE